MLGGKGRILILFSVFLKKFHIFSGLVFISIESFRVIIFYHLFLFSADKMYSKKIAKPPKINQIILK